MKRLPTFAFLGPFLTWLIVIVCLGVAMHPKPIFEQAWYWPSSVILCYMFTILPMLFAAWIDRKLSAKWWRSLVCFAAAFGIAFALYYQFMHEGTSGAENARIFRENWFYVGLVWGLPAAVCSWLSDRFQQNGGIQ